MQGKPTGVKALRNYIAMRDAMPLGGLADCVHAIHTGSEYEAEIGFSDLKAVSTRLAIYEAALREIGAGRYGGASLIARKALDTP